MGDGREVQEGGDVCLPGCFVLMYGRNWHSVVKQLSSNFKKKVKNYGTFTFFKLL